MAVTNNNARQFLRMITFFLYYMHINALLDQALVYRLELLSSISLCMESLGIFETASVATEIYFYFNRELHLTLSFCSTKYLLSHVVL